MALIATRLLAKTHATSAIAVLRWRHLASLAAAFLLFQSATKAQYYDQGTQVNPTGVSHSRGASFSQDADPSTIRQWFKNYDLVRRQAQMSPQERRQADTMLSKGMSLLAPGPEKTSSQQLLTKLVVKYNRACQQLEHLPLLPQTEQLHRGYHQYFSSAKNLFTDYLRVQNNLFAVDSRTGNPIAGQLMERKASLEALDQQNKYLDEQLRQKFGIPPYQY